jgi:hypothetical protein
VARRLKAAAVTLAAGICVAGPLAGVVLPLVPAAWRRPALAWGILLAAVAFVAWVRRRRLIRG